MGKLFGKNADGVHLMSAVLPEFTLCGNAFDVNAVDSHLGEIVSTKETRVTCLRCIAEILNCRRVRIDKPATEKDNENLTKEILND